MSLTKDSVTAALKHVLTPDGRDLVASGSVKWVAACDTYAGIRLLVSGASPKLMATLAATAYDAVKSHGGAPVDAFVVEFVDDAGTVVHEQKFGATAPAAVQPPREPVPQGHTPINGLKQQPARAAGSALPGVKRIIAVGAGKGGVGKSTVSLNLAVGLARRGHSVGLLDGDIYGPSMPTMLGLSSLDAVVHKGMLQPFLTHGIKCMTIGKLVDSEKPLIWRGPMAHGAFKQLTEQTAWGELDYLVIDLPPGTGDVSLTMSQMLAVTGAVVVCTPQRVAQDDAIRAARMFQQLHIPVLGVVENMSYFIGDDGKLYDLFGKGGAEHMAQRLGVPFLGSLPITMGLRINSDKGDPTSNFTATDGAGVRLKGALEELVTRFEQQTALAEISRGGEAPVLKIS
jgi:ATP-binding protein involved in chromosome partitioning